MCSPYIYYMIQPFPEANHIYQTCQANFDRMLFNALKKYHSCPGFALLLGSILNYKNLHHQPFGFPPGLVASLYLVHQQGQGHVLTDLSFSGITGSNGEIPRDSNFLTYFIELLEDPERLGSRAFDQHRYASAAKECLQLCLCNHHKFSKGVTESVYRDKALLRNKPWAWKARLGIHSRIRKAMRHLTVRRWKSFKALMPYNIHQPQGSSEHEYYLFLSYQWKLDLFPIFLEKSAISLQLADLLRTRTFTTMAQRYPRRMRLAREAIAAYLLRVEEFVIGSP